MRLDTRRKQRACRPHQYTVDGFGTNRGGEQTVRERCIKCDKRKETTGKQQLAFQKMRAARRYRESLSTLTQEN